MNGSPIRACRSAGGMFSPGYQIAFVNRGGKYVAQH